MEIERSLPKFMDKMLYEDEFQRALTEDGSSSSTYLTPQTYYPGA